MKIVVSCLAAVAFSCALIGPVVAQQPAPKDTYDPPRGVEGPELRKQPPKGTGETGAPKAGKKSPRAGGQKPKPADSSLPKTSPGPEVTRDDGKKDSVTR